jgi:uncharacterized Zn finger protein (UPF0148 family)
MANALDANGILRPTDGMTNATRRPDGIMYAKIACDLTFASLDEGNVTTSPYSFFFIRLHTETITVQNSTGNDVVLNTFHGDSNGNLSADQADVDAVFDHTRSYGKPFMLKPPTIALDVHADAVLEDWTSTLEDIALEASWPTITTKVFTLLCPNIIDDPISVIQNIHQVSTTDNKASTIVQPVTQYFKSIQQMTAFFPKNQDWEMDVVRHFITHLCDDLRQEMNADKFTYNAATSGKDAYCQLMNLQRAYAAAIIAEESISRVHKIAKEAVSNHSFIAKLNSSVAEDTLNRYSGGNNTTTCWGCGKPGHGFADKAGNVICPDKDKTGISEAADKKRKEFNNKLKKKKKNDGRKKRDASTLLSTALESMSGDEIKALISGRHVGKKAKQGVRTFHIQVFEANSAKDIKPLLPISIETNLSHIPLPIGQNLETSSISILVAYDTCAAVNIGHLGHHLQIAEKFPQVVKSLTYAADKYSPLMLSGIVTETEGKSTVKPTTTLPAIIENWLPFRTKEGHRTTLKIALGHHVSVNTIIGMPMIKPAKLSLDLSDNVVEAGVLDTEPFPVIYRPTIWSAPDFSKVHSDDAKLLVTDSPLDHITADEGRACTVALIKAKPDTAAMTSQMVKFQEPQSAVLSALGVF